MNDRENKPQPDIDLTQAMRVRAGGLAVVMAVLGISVFVMREDEQKKDTAVQRDLHAQAGAALSAVAGRGGLSIRLALKFARSAECPADAPYAAGYELADVAKDVVSKGFLCLAPR